MRQLLTLFLLVALTLPAGVARAAEPAGAAAPHTLTLGTTLSSTRAVEPLPLHAGPLTPDTPLRSRSGFTVWGLEAWFARRHPALRGTAAAFLEAEQRYRVNARALLAIAGGESGWGTSWIARNKRNLFGFGALHRDPERYAASFPTLRAGILHVARFIDRHYLRPGGRYAHGATLRGMMRKWAPAGSWARMVARVSRGINPADPLRDLRWGAPTLRPLRDPFNTPRLELVVPIAARRGLPAPADLTACLRLAAPALTVAPEPPLCPKGELVPGTAEAPTPHLRWILPLPPVGDLPRLFSLEIADRGGRRLDAQPAPFGAGITGRLDPAPLTIMESPLLFTARQPEAAGAWRLVLFSPTSLATPLVEIDRIATAPLWRGQGGPTRFD